MKDREFSRLYRKLGYKFRNPALLARALTHSSASHSENNEQLEFLGDSVIQLVVTRSLYAAGGSEGSMTAERQRLVSHAPLKDASRRLGLPDCIIKGSADIGEKALSSVYEAVAGAVFADGGYAAAEKFVLRTLMAAHTEAPENFKGRLQEYLQGRKKERPVYATAQVGGTANRPLFRCVLAADGKYFEGEGGSKAEAERAAAERAICFFEKRRG